MQFCRMYTGDDGKSHFEDLDQSEGAKFFQSALTVKALMFKHDQNRDDLHGWHNSFDDLGTQPVTTNMLEALRGLRRP